MTQRHAATPVARLLGAHSIASEPNSTSSRKPLPLALDDHGAFETHVLAMLDRYWWQPRDYEAVMPATFGTVLALANEKAIDLHRKSLVQRGFLEPTGEQGIYDITKLGEFALDYGLNPGVAHDLAGKAIDAMPQLVKDIPEF